MCLRMSHDLSIGWSRPCGVHAASLAGRSEPGWFTGGRNRGTAPPRALTDRRPLHDTKLFCDHQKLCLPLNQRTAVFHRRLLVKSSFALKGPSDFKLIQFMSFRGHSGRVDHEIQYTGWLSDGYEPRPWVNRVVHKEVNCFWKELLCGSDNMDVYSLNWNLSKSRIEFMTC